MAGGHIALVSFDGRSYLLWRISVSPRPSGESRRRLPNGGSSKLRRRTRRGHEARLLGEAKHSTRLRDRLEGVPSCAVEAAFDNQAPEGLTPYVAVDQPVRHVAQLRRDIDPARRGAHRRLREMLNRPVQPLCRRRGSVDRDLRRGAHVSSDERSSSSTSCPDGTNTGSR